VLPTSVTSSLARFTRRHRSAIGGFLTALVLLAAIMARWKKHFAEVICEMLDNAAASIHFDINGEQVSPASQ
jgi:hypothetical protein